MKERTQLARRLAEYKTQNNYQRVYVSFYKAQVNMETNIFMFIM